MNKGKPDPRLKEFGKNLKRIRTEKKLSLRELSQNCNIDFSDIGKYERGEVNATYITIIELANALEVEPADLVTILPAKTSK
jgi:transcriptional regulator with XRE-family HTH domain